MSDHPLDYASVGSAMGHTADFALGIALARPDRKVLALNGDGSMLMCLGTLATIAGLEKPARNFYLFVCHNGTYEVTGNQHIPGRSGFSFSTIARGVGLEKVYDFNTAESLDASLPDILNEDGPRAHHPGDDARQRAAAASKSGQYGALSDWHAG